ncbi:MAG: cob(I)yrinic acid a,c-diamide adenosyltransferase [Prevotellaceae bacterium]|nr:cob(I)yrinic acid a,c-diamide adenosyltransferase [Prevotella sp.]MDD7257481.1 cob(I)yrinic acid a,c-diamide adenosyltransferase [Prevotellaceae bacterium]MDY6131620.1 cob(I)yrinic acid a,c-diamide adenosyltransferase [Prevotella sp.]
MALSKIYTKTGDQGTTCLVGGIKVKKTDARIEAYGTVDELSANLGLLASWMKDSDDKDIIIRTQRNLFTVCSYLATDKSKTPLAPSYTMAPEETRLLEEQIDEINSSIPPQTSFIIPGGSHEAAMAHVCRTVCRRAERRIFYLAQTTELDEEVTQYINRLSDYLFVLARKLNFIDGVREKSWKKSK